MKIIGEIDEAVLLRAAVFENHYINQKGGLLSSVFTEDGVFDQRGEGFGTFIRGLWRGFKPSIISGLKAVGNQALRSAGGFIGDVASGVDWREAGSERLNEAGRNLTDKLESKMSRVMAGGGGGMQYGGNKTHHSAVKLFSFSPPTVQRGRHTRKRKRSVVIKASKRRRGGVKRRGAKKRVSKKKKHRAAAGSVSKKRRRRRRKSKKRSKKQRKTSAVQIGSGFNWL